MHSDADTLSGGFPHSEIPGSKLVCQLPWAYRRLPRLSSPVAAKASTICAYSLDHITPNRLGYRHIDFSRVMLSLEATLATRRDNITVYKFQIVKDHFSADD